jgi:hypothetical protein
MLYAINNGNSDYEKLSSWIRDNNFCIPKGDGTFIKIPKPREAGIVFGALVERSLAEWKDNDPEAFTGFVDSIKTNFMPPTRTIAAPLNDIRANKNFMNTPIVPGYMENLSPRQQADENTSSVAKTIGNKMNWSPKQIDYVVRSYTGVLGQLGIPALSEGGSVKETLIRQVTADPVYSNDTVNRFYEKKIELDTASSDAKYTGGMLEADKDKYRKLYGKVADTIGDTRDQMKAIEKDTTIPADVKKAQLRGLQAAIVTMAGVSSKPEAEQIDMYNKLVKSGRIEEAKPKTEKQTKKAADSADKKYKELSGLFLQ